MAEIKVKKDVTQVEIDAFFKYGRGPILWERDPLFEVPSDWFMMVQVSMLRDFEDLQVGDIAWVMPIPNENGQVNWWLFRDCSRKQLEPCNSFGIQPGIDFGWLMKDNPVVPYLEMLLGEVTEDGDAAIHKFIEEWEEDDS